MAEVMTSVKSHGKSYSKRKNIHVDMTPMVDLGFLLISFFMLVTNFAKPNVMDLGLPAKGPVPVPVDIGEKNQVTFILGENNEVFYYQKEADHLVSSDLKSTTLEGLEVAKLIKELKNSAPKPEIFTVIIKPSDDSTYKNFVDVMDEMAISGHEIYGVTDLKPHEKQIYHEISNK